MVTTKVIAHGIELDVSELVPVLDKINTLLDKDTGFVALEGDEYDILGAWDGWKVCEDMLVFRKVF